MVDFEKEKQAAKDICELLPQSSLELEDLCRLALDQRGGSSALADELWSIVDPDLWAKKHNPWMILQMLSGERLLQLGQDKTFLKILQKHMTLHHDMLSYEGWFKKTHPNSPLKQIAYFSMEYGLSEALPIYSGGLGMLAGDHLKAASDLEVPIVAIGLLYQQGYFRQYFDQTGRQKEIYPFNDPSQLPITRTKKKDGSLLSIHLEFPGRLINFRVWEVQVGKITLYLLDSNDAFNTPVDRSITNELYGGDSEHRLQQEIVLGIGGWKLLEALGISPEICHLNEGHAAFAMLARAKSFMEKNDVSFEKALAVTRAGNLFTTHTPVAAGFDRFSPELISTYFSSYVTSLGISIHDLLSLGRENQLDSNEPLNMAYLAFRGSGAVNAVSRLHGEVSRKLFAPLFPRWPIEEIPVGYITNGVHPHTWESPEADMIWKKACGIERWLGFFDNAEAGFKNVSDEELWAFRNHARDNLVKYVRMRFSYQKRTLARPVSELALAEHIFDPNVLTIGFARRFAEYKRVNLLLYDQERLLRLITDAKRPVQIVMAGKAHPQDNLGKGIIEQWLRFINRPEVRPHVVFLFDYDILVAERLVQGVDLWINTPRRPWEASGTSGMKLLVNGGLNLSELDGWWAEAYSPDVGWALGDGKEHGNDPAWDKAEAESLFTLLENEVIPSFYHRDPKGIPLEWIARIRASMIKLTPQYSTSRMVREYTENYYLPGAKLYLQRAEDHGMKGGALQNWCKSLHDHWKSVQFLDMQLQTFDNHYQFQVKVRLGEIPPDEVRVELYAAALPGQKPFHQEMECKGKEEGTVYIYAAQVPTTRPSQDYTPRIIPGNREVLVPAEAEEILWQH